MNKIVILIVIIFLINMIFTMNVKAEGGYYLNDNIGFLSSYEKQQYYYWAKKFEKNCGVTLTLECTSYSSRNDLFSVNDSIEDKCPSGNGVFHIRVYKDIETKNMKIWVGRSVQLELQITDISIGSYLPSTSLKANDINWLNVKNLIEKLYIHLLYKNDSPEEYVYVDTDVNDYNLKFNRLNPTDESDYARGAVISREWYYNPDIPDNHDEHEEEPNSEEQDSNIRLIVPYYKSGSSSGTLSLYVEDKSFRNSNDNYFMFVYRFKYRGQYKFNWELEYVTYKLPFNYISDWIYCGSWVMYTPPGGQWYKESGWQNGYTDDDYPYSIYMSSVMKSDENRMNGYLVKINDIYINPYPPVPDDEGSGGGSGGEEPGGENPGSEEPPPDDEIPGKIKEGIEELLPHEHLHNSLKKLSELSTADYEPPIFKINLNQLLNPASHKISPDLMNKADKDVVYLDMSVLEEVKFLGIPVIKYFRGLLSGAMIFMTAFYIWRKLVPNDTIS